jgi:hypothetical protein
LVAPCPPLSPLFFVCSNAQQTLWLYRNVEKLFCLEHFSDNAPLFNAPITWLLFENFWGEKFDSCLY